MSSIKTLESSFLQFIQTYKNIFNTTFASIQTQPSQSQESINQKRLMVENFFHSYKNILSIIDSLEEVNTEQHDKHSSQKPHQQELSLSNSMVHIPNHSMVHIGNLSSAHNIGGLNSVESKHDKYEREVCEQHDKAVHRYKKTLSNADVWRQKLYTYINENLPSGNN